MQFIFCDNFDIMIIRNHICPVESLNYSLAIYSVYILPSKIVKYADYLFDSFMFALCI